MLISVTVPLLKNISGSSNLELPQEPVNDHVRGLFSCKWSHAHLSLLAVGSLLIFETNGFYPVCVKVLVFSRSNIQQDLPTLKTAQRTCSGLQTR